MAGIITVIQAGALIFAKEAFIRMYTDLPPVAALMN